jgi:predicted Zn-dependent protease
MNELEIIDYLEKISKKNNVLFEYSKTNIEKSEINGFDIEKTTNCDEENIVISTIVNNKKGKYVVKKITKKNIDEGINKAKKLAKIKTEKEIDCFGDVAPKKKINFDKTIETIDYGDMLKEIKTNLTKDKYITSYLGGIYKIKTKDYIITNNINIDQEKQFIKTGFEINTKKEVQNSGHFSSIFTKKEDVNISECITQAKINAITLLSPKQGDKGTYSLILTPEIVHDIISYFVLEACKGDLIYKKESYLNSLKNKQIFCKNLSLVEDPHLDYFLGSSLVDEEAIKTNNKNIIDNGIFKKIIYDQKYGMLTNNKSTGNSFLGSISFTNILQKPGSKKISDIIETTKKGLLVYSIMGIHTNNLVTGDFSLTISNAKEIVNGEYKRTVTNLNLTGNIKDLLKEISFSKEQMFFGNALFSFGIINNVKII